MLFSKLLNPRALPNPFKTHIIRNAVKIYLTNSTLVANSLALPAYYFLFYVTHNPYFLTILIKRHLLFINLLLDSFDVDPKYRKQTHLNYLSEFKALCELYKMVMDKTIDHVANLDGFVFAVEGLNVLLDFLVYLITPEYLTIFFSALLIKDGLMKTYLIRIIDRLSTFSIIDLREFIVYFRDETGFYQRYAMKHFFSHSEVVCNGHSFNFFDFYLISKTAVSYIIKHPFIIIYYSNSSNLQISIYSIYYFVFKKFLFIPCLNRLLNVRSDLINYDRFSKIINQLNINFGHHQFILAGGESNPGPIFSRLATAARNYFLPELSDVVNKITTTCSKTSKVIISVLYLNRLFDSLLDVIGEMFSRFATSTLSFYSRLLTFCLNLYDTYSMLMQQLGLRVSFAHHQSGPFEHFAAAAFLSAILPNQLKFILKEIPIYTSFKIIDDSTWIFDLFSFIISLPRIMLEHMCNPETDLPTVYQGLLAMEELLPFGEPGKFSYKARLLIDELEKTPAIINNKNFQTRFNEFYTSYSTFKSSYLSRKPVLPPFLKDLDTKLISYSKTILYLCSPSRPEPVCLVFAGPAGTGKTTLMRELLAHWSTHNSIYQHISEEKDFFDQYGNQDIFCYDDIGQKGVYQWSNLINMVSTLKCPLQCADAKLKGTKEFTSRVLMLSTNNLNITLTADCGISDRNALYRRLRVFDFANVRLTTNGVNRTFTGELIFKVFNLNTSQWDVVDTFDLDTVSIDNVKCYIHRYVALSIRRNTEIIQQTQVFQDYPAFSDAASFQSGDSYLSTFYDLISKTSDTILNILSYIQSLLPNYDSLSTTIFDLITSDGCVLLAIASIVSYAAYSAITRLYDDTQKLTVNKISKHYHSDKYEKLKIDQVVPQSIEDIFSLQNEIDIPQLRRFKDQTFVAQFSYLVDNKYRTESSTIVLSGKHFSAPMHCFNFSDPTVEIFVTIYSSPNKILYDKALAKIVWHSINDDIVICRLPDAMPSYTSLITIPESSSNYDLFLITPKALHKMDKVRVTDLKLKFYHPRTKFQSEIGDTTNVFYDLNLDGICGSLLVNTDGFVLGHHVAVVTSNRTEFGTSRIFSKETINALRKYFKTPPTNNVSLSIDKHVLPSAVTIDTKNFAYIPTDSSYSKSQIFGVFDELRKPAQLKPHASKDGILDLTSTSFQVSKNIDLTPFPFVEKCMKEILPQKSNTFFDERAVVLGDNNLNRIDPKTSVGHGLTGTKHDYLDYENGKIKPAMKQIIIDLLEKIRLGTFKYDTYFVTTLKDELRNLKDDSSPKDPRVFTAGSLQLTILYRIYLGTLFSSIFTDRKRNGIMVGINPFSEEWGELVKLHASLNETMNYSFDGDYEKWDKNMLPQFQRLLNKIVKDWFLSHDHNRLSLELLNSILSTNYSIADNEKFFDLLLELIISTPLLTYDLSYIKSHGMPSGIAVTTFFNSLINKMYTSYAFYLLFNQQSCNKGRVPLVSDFIYGIVDTVYGDDKLTTVREDLQWFNALSYKQIMDEISIGFTSAEKTKITQPFKNFYDCSFLKRTFYYHHILNRYVAPLEIRSMCSTLNYVKDEFRNEELTRIKCQNFQREAFLHPAPYYDNFMSKLKTKLDQTNFYVPFLTDEVLVDLYNVGEFGTGIEFT